MPGKWTSITPPFGDPRYRYGVGAPRARPPERSGASGPPRATAMGGPAGRSPPVYPKISLTRWRRRATGAPAGAERGVGARASDGEGGAGGARPPGLPQDIFDAMASARHGRARRSGAGRRGPRERRRWGVRRGEAPRSTQRYL